MCLPKTGGLERWMNDVFCGSVCISWSFVGRVIK